MRLPPGERERPHEAGVIAKGWPWRRRWALYCNTCGRTSEYVRSRDLAYAAADLHSGNPRTPLGTTLSDFDRINEAIKGL